MEKKDRTLTTGRWKWRKKEEQYKSSRSVKIHYFQSILALTIALGLMWHIYLLYDIFPRDAHLLFEIFYLSMNILLFILGTTSISTDIKHNKKITYNSIGLVLAIVFLNFNLIIMILDERVFVELTLFHLFIYYLVVGMGFAILLLMMIRTMVSYLRSEKAYTQPKRSINMLKLSVSTMLVVIIILFILLANALIIFFFGGNFITKGQAFVDVGDLWDWGAFLRNAIIVGVAFAFFLIVEIELDYFFDWEDQSSHKIRAWRQRTFRKIGDWFRRIFRRG